MITKRTKPHHTESRHHIFNICYCVKMLPSFSSSTQLLQPKSPELAEQLVKKKLCSLQQCKDFPHFEELNDHESQISLLYARCKCGKYLSFNRKIGLSHIKRHQCTLSQASSASKATEEVKTAQKLPGSCLGNFLMKKVTATDAEQSSIKEKQVSFVINKLRPISILEDETLRDLLFTYYNLGAKHGRCDFTNFQNEFIYGRTTIRKYIQVKAKALRESRVLDGDIVLVIDHWKESMTSRQFLGMMNCIITSTGQYETHLLDIKEVNKTSAEETVNHLRAALEPDYKQLENMTVMSDRASSMLSACRINNHLNCACHRLHNISEKVTKSIPELSTCVSTLSSFVEMCKRRGINKALKDSGGSSLTRPINVRWNSIVVSTKDVISNYELLKTILSTRELYQQLNSLVDLQPMLDNLVKFLDPLRVATLELESVTQATLHLVVSVISNLQRHYTQLQGQFPALNFWSRAFTLILAEIAKWRTELTNQHLAAYILNPRKRQMRSLLLMEKQRAQDFINHQLSSVIPPSCSTQSPDLFQQQPQCKVPRFGCTESDDEEESDRLISPALEEFVRYMALPANQIDSGQLDEGINLWWSRQGKALFPCLSKIALTLLAIPASSTAAEQLFSKSKLLFSPLRSRLTSELAGDILLLHFNKK